MISFLDGPAKGTELNLSRIPVYLRVVIDKGGKVDALDQESDKARPSESIYAYRIVDGTTIKGFYCGRKRGKGCTVFTQAQYEMCPTQPDDTTMRSRALWEQWVFDIEKLSTD